MHSIYIGNPISLVLAISTDLSQANYFIVQEEKDLRESPRNTNLAMELQKCISLFFGIPFNVITFQEFETNYFTEKNFVTEFRFVSYFRKIKPNGVFPSVTAISYGADLFLAETNLLNRFRGPRTFKVVLAWRRALHEISNTKEFLIPELPTMPNFINKIPVKSIRKSVLVENLIRFSRSADFADFSGVKNLEKLKLIIVGPDYLGFDQGNLNAIISVILKLPSKTDFAVLIKPHPASDIPLEMIQKFEALLGSKTLNSLLDLDIERIKTIPLEIFLSANDLNYYVGIYTAGVAMIETSRVTWVPSSDKFAEKMYKINYKEFINRWS